MTKSNSKSKTTTKAGAQTSAAKATTRKAPARKAAAKTTGTATTKSTVKSAPRKASTPKKAPGKTATAKTTAAKTTAAKTTAAKKDVTAPAPVAAPEPTAAAPKVAPVVVTSAAPTVMTEMRKEQLLDEVAKHSGAKRKDVKPIVEAALEVMGEALGDGQELNLKPLGKVKIARTKQVANGRVINLRLRQSIQVIKELDETKEAAE